MSAMVEVSPRESLVKEEPGVGTENLKGTAYKRGYYDPSFFRYLEQIKAPLDFSLVPDEEKGADFNKYRISDVGLNNDHILKVLDKPLPHQSIAKCEVEVSGIGENEKKTSLVVTLRSLEEHEYQRARREVKLTAEFKPLFLSKLRKGEYLLVAPNPIPEFDCLAGDINVVYKKAFLEALKEAGLSLSKNGKYIYLPVSEEAYLWRLDGIMEVVDNLFGSSR